MTLAGARGGRPMVPAQRVSKVTVLPSLRSP